MTTYQVDGTVRSAHPGRDDWVTTPGHSTTGSHSRRPRDRGDVLEATVRGWRSHTVPRPTQKRRPRLERSSRGTFMRLPVEGE
jgi:hypothetical protein